MPIPEKAVPPRQLADSSRRVYAEYQPSGEQDQTPPANVDVPPGGATFKQADTANEGGAKSAAPRAAATAGGGGGK